MSLAATQNGRYMNVQQLLEQCHSNSEAQQQYTPNLVYTNRKGSDQHACFISTIYLNVYGYTHAFLPFCKERQV